MASFNKVILMGRLTAAPELKQTQTGTPVTSFSIAVDRKFAREGQQKTADFFTVIAWRQTAEFICKYFGKGQAILVCGELQSRTYTDRVGQKHYVTEIIASEAAFCEAKKDGADVNAAAQDNSPAYAPAVDTAPNFEEISGDENLPF